MARYTCPSCGAEFNGRKCKKCFYVNFTEEISHGLHTHAGEPLVIKAPVRKRIPRKDPFGCDRGRRGIPKWLRTIIVWILVVNLLPMGIAWIQEGIDQARAPEPEQVLNPLATKLWENDQLTVWAEPQKGDAMEIPILMENRSRDDVTLTAQSILLGDFQTTYSHLYVDAEKESWGRGYLYLDDEDLSYSGVGPFTQIRCDLEAYDSDSYDTLHEAQGIIIPLEQSVYGAPAPEGLLLLDTQNICIRYLGYRGEGGQWQFLFLAENRSDGRVSLWSEEASIDAETADVSLWEELAPGATAVVRGYYYSEGHQQPEELTLTVGISDGEVYTVLNEDAPFVVSLK